MMYRDRFVVSIIANGYPVKETGPVHARQVALPFDTEYKIRLKNKHDRSCTARVFIDGKKVSMLGDFVIGANSSIDLERFVDVSLSEGNKFKFVSLNDPNVDDPSSVDNGVLKVEFRLAKENEVVLIKPSTWSWPEPVELPSWPQPADFGSPRWFYYTDNTSSAVYNYYNKTLVECCNAESLCESGATVEGSKSNQSFVYSTFIVEDVSTIIQLKLVGISKNDAHYRDANFCSKCGRKINSNDRYCSGCGKKLQ